MVQPKDLLFCRSLSTAVYAIVNGSTTNLFCVCTSGQSSVNFIYNLVEAHVGAHGDFSLKEGRPLSGQTTFRLLSSS